MATDEQSNVQPVSPQNEGVDPLTEGNTLYPVHNTKAESAKLAKVQASDAAQNVGKSSKAEKKTAKTVADQQKVEGNATTPDAAAKQ